MQATPAADVAAASRATPAADAAAATRDVAATQGGSGGRGGGTGVTFTVTTPAFENMPGWAGPRQHDVRDVPARKHNYATGGAAASRPP
jgi:hypothetical protein